MICRASVLFGCFLSLFGASVAHGWVTIFPQGAIIGLRVTADGDVVAAGGPEVLKASGGDGSVLWRAPNVPYGGGATPQGGGPLLAIDGAGDIAVAGTSVGVSTNSMHATKLNGPTGAVMWSADGLPGSSNAVAIDGANDVIIAGAGNVGFAVAKLAGTDGTVLWQYVIPGGIAFAVTVDANGDVIAAGYALNVPNDDDATVVKLDGATGVELWRHNSDSGAGRADFAFALALDAAGNVVTAGGGQGPVGTEYFTVEKISATDGSGLWRYAVPGNDPSFPEAQAVAVAVDAAGDVIAAGETSNVGNTLDFAVVKLDGASGTERWSQALAGTAPTLNADRALQVAVDGAGDVFAAGQISNLGSSQTSDDEDFAVVKLAGSSGAQLWRVEMNGTQTSRDAAYALGLDAAGNVFAGGELSDFDADAVLVKLSEGIPARKLLVSDPGDQTRRRLNFVASRADLVVPAETSTGDPTVGGAQLELLNPTTGEHAVIPLPASHWTQRAPFDHAGRGYQYTDHTGSAGPCRSVLLTPHSVKAKCVGTGLSFSLDEVTQGSLGVVLTTGGGNNARYCVLFATAVIDRPGRFVAAAADAPAACPTVP
ncbi:MAG TPA: PQQ-binding-like beta-propeller repeat protein [Candidatus Dormibacteraeota bacterium]|nr:PQQ-binding-like beta-propeller repeat protein [Candidatus Dormibacteraeota bacterium]